MTWSSTTCWATSCAEDLRHRCAGESASGVYIVTSEEPMSLYAANNIAKAVVRFSRNDVALGGLIVNLREKGDFRALLEAFAARLGTRICATIPRDALIRKAENRFKTVVEYAPGAPSSSELVRLADSIRNTPQDAVFPLPTPLDQDEFVRFVREHLGTDEGDEPGREGNAVVDRAESAAQLSVDSRVVVAGPAAVNAFHHILGIPPALRDNGTYQVTRVVWNHGALQIDLAGRGFDRAVLRVRAGGEASEAGIPLRISVDGPEEGRHPAVARLLQGVQNRLARTPMAGLLDLIRRDPATTTQPLKSESDGTDTLRAGANLVPRPYVHEWTGKPGELGQWGLFFDDLVFVYTAFTRVNFVVPRPMSCTAITSASVSLPSFGPALHGYSTIPGAEPVRQPSECAAAWAWGRNTSTNPSGVCRPTCPSSTRSLAAMRSSGARCGSQWSAKATGSSECTRPVCPRSWARMSSGLWSSSAILRTSIAFHAAWDSLTTRACMPKSSSSVTRNPR